jgi:hypothetical protein
MKKNKFLNLATNNEAQYLSSNKESLKAKELALILGGAGCESRICENVRSYGVEEFCPGAIGACVSGVGVCTNKTNGSVVPYNPTFSDIKDATTLSIPTGIVAKI